MNPSSLDIDLLLRRAKGSAVQRQKDMNRNRLGDELGETNKWFGSELIDDEGCSYRVIFFSGIRELTAFGSPSTIENFISARQQPERSGAHEADEGGRITHLKLERYLNYFISIS
jgi:hypothetical protein